MVTDDGDGDDGSKYRCYTGTDRKADSVDKLVVRGRPALKPMFVGYESDNSRLMDLICPCVCLIVKLLN